jgi:hypothetical protein
MASIETEPREEVVMNSSETDTFRDKAAPKEMADVEYPRGLKFVALAGASIIAVFLIALDQVCSSHDHSSLSHGRISVDKGNYRPSLARLSPR